VLYLERPAGLAHPAGPSFRRLSPIRRTSRACATITSCPSSDSSRLIHGECVPVSNAIRLRGSLPKISFTASGRVATLASRITSPAPLRTQQKLDRSPRSSPMVSCPSCTFLIRHNAVVLGFSLENRLSRYLLVDLLRQQRNPVPQAFQSSDEIALEAVGIQSIEIVAA
jgi:hypothetical protein